MPYDVFSTDQDPDSLHTAWEFRSTHKTLQDARRALERIGHEETHVRRWALFYVRRTTAHTGAMHSQGEYPQKETPHGA